MCLDDCVCVNWLDMTTPSWWRKKVMVYYYYPLLYNVYGLRCVLMTVCVLSDLTWLPLLGGGRKSCYAIIILYWSSTNIFVFLAKQNYIYIYIYYCSSIVKKSRKVDIKYWKIIYGYRIVIACKTFLKNLFLIQ